MPWNSNGPTFQTATIAASASLSGQINLGALTLHGIIVPANWTAADLTFQASNDGGTTWFEVFTVANAAVDYPVTAGAWVALDPTLWRGINCLKIRSGTKAVPVNQTNAATLTLVLQPVL